MLWLVVVFYYYLKTLGEVHHFGSDFSLGVQTRYQQNFDHLQTELKLGPRNIN